MRMSLMRHPCVSFGGKTLLDGLSDLLDGCVPTEFFYLLVLHNFPQSECVGDLARPYSMSLPAVSKHLRVLENAGLVRRRRNGRVHSLKLEAAPMKAAAQWIEEYRRFWEQSLDRLDEYLQELQAKEKKHDDKKIPG